MMELTASSIHTFLALHPVIIYGIAIIIASALLYLYRPMTEFLVIMVAAVPYILVTLWVTMRH